MKSNHKNWERIEIKIDINKVNETEKCVGLEDKPSISIWNYKKGRQPNGHIRGDIEDAVQDVRKLLERKWSTMKEK